MSYTDMDIEIKALELLGSHLPDEDAPALRAMCTAAAGELKARLRTCVKAEDISELFVTACAMRAVAMYMELGSVKSGRVSGFTAGELSVRLDGSAAAALRKNSEDMLAAYMDKGGFEFSGVSG